MTTTWKTYMGMNFREGSRNWLQIVRSGGVFFTAVLFELIIWLIYGKLKVLHLGKTGQVLQVKENFIPREKEHSSG